MLYKFTLNQKLNKNAFDYINKLLQSRNILYIIKITKKTLHNSHTEIFSLLP